MGSCISKCRPKKSSHNSQEEEENQFNHVQDKLVIISQPPPKIQTPLKPINKISSPSPPASPSASTSSASSSLITCSSTTNTATSRSISSSSATSSKEYYRSSSFSNEFLWSCYKENPHIIRINSIKENSFTATTTNTTFVKPLVSTPKKRVRSSSPSSTTALSRQKSFRRDYQNCRTPTRSSSSPSPSRRFVDGDLINLQNKEPQRHSKRAVGTNSTSFSRKECSSLRPPSPNNNINNNSCTRLIRPCLRSTSTSTGEQYFNNNIHRIGSSKIDEIAVAEAVLAADQHEIDPVIMEDIDNPLISLDCFIFI